MHLIYYYSMSDYNSTVSHLEKDRNTVDADRFIANEKILIDPSKNISKALSKQILDEINVFSNDGRVDWNNLILSFDCTNNQELIMKKIKTHYYNQKAKEKKIKLKKLKTFLFLRARFLRNQFS